MLRQARGEVWIGVKGGRCIEACKQTLDGLVMSRFKLEASTRAVHLCGE